MSETAQSRAGILSETPPPTYRVILLAGCGTVHGVMPLAADDDEQARHRARRLVDGHAVELWDGLRFIDHFPPLA